jgi:hypothetical protein
MRSIAAAIVLMLLPSGGAATADKPKLTLKANPVMAFSPASIHVTADLVGGANDDQTLYCPAVEWEWGDGTKSAEESDCEPYQAGKSEIKRHYIAEHEFRVEEPNVGGPPSDYRDFHIQLRLKRSGKVILSGATSVKIKPESDR